MNNIENLNSQRLKFGDTAVDGLICGIWAGIAMAGFIVIAGWLAGDSLSTSVSRFSIHPNTTPWMTVITHLAISAVYGLFFALIVLALSRLVRPSIWINLLTGVVYGFTLWIVANSILLSVFSSSLNEIPGLTLMIGHLIYGLVLGFSMSSKVMYNG